MRLSKMILWLFLGTLSFSAGLMAQAVDTFGTENLGKPDKAFPPYKVIGNIYFVGTDALASFLIVTPAGNILLDSTYERNVPLIRASVEKLGFQFKDIKILLSSHSHIDHVEGDALVKQLTGATVMIMDRDVPAAEAIRPGGKPHPIDRVLHHLDRVSLGGTTLIAHLTPGHTEGDTTWTLKVNDDGKTYDVVIPGAIAPNPGTHLADNTAYPYIIEDNLFFYKYLRILPCDVMLGSHTAFYNMQEKYAKLDKGGPNPFIDGQQGCLNLIDQWEKLFQSRIVDDAKRIAGATAK
jgi:metallo-beta-lactamase class B